MSKSYLTIAQAYTKLGLAGGGTSWIRKSELISTGKADESLLTKYGNNDFVTYEDIELTENILIDQFRVNETIIEIVLNANDGGWYSKDDFVYLGGERNIEVRVHVTNIGQKMLYPAVTSEIGNIYDVPCGIQYESTGNNSAYLIWNLDFTGYNLDNYCRIRFNVINEMNYDEVFGFVSIWAFVD